MGRGPRVRTALSFKGQLGFRRFRGITRSRRRRLHSTAVLRIQGRREPYQMPTCNPIPRGGQGAIEVVIGGRSVVSSGHRAIFSPKGRGIGFFPVVLAHVVRGWHQNMCREGAAGANPAFRTLRQFGFKSFGALRARAFDKEQYRLGPVAMVH